MTDAPPGAYHRPLPPNYEFTCRGVSETVPGRGI